MRIAFFSEVYWPMVSGVTRTLERTVQGLEARGHAVRVYSASYPLPPGAADRPEVHRSPSRSLFLAPEVQWAFPRPGAILADLTAFQPDVVHFVTEFAMGQAGRQAAASLGVPVVASAHTDYERYAERYGMGWAVWPGWQYLRGFYRAARVVLAPSDTFRERLTRRGVARTGIWSRGVDRSEFHPRYRSDAWRARHGAGRHDLVVLHVGRLAPEKNIEVLLDAWERLSRRRPRAHLVFVGEGRMADVIRARALPRVQLAGTLRGEALATAYASADIGAFPSTTETFGNVLLEAMASGLPSVAAAAGGTLEIAEHEQDALLVAPNDAATFTRGLARMLADAQLRQRLKAGGLLTAASRDWAPVLDGLLAEYRRALLPEPLAQAA